jgi:hypothetical protein
LAVAVTLTLWLGGAVSFGDERDYVGRNDIRVDEVDKGLEKNLLYEFP